MKTPEQLAQEISLLQQQLDEANETIDAIRTGQVDALIVKHDTVHQLYTLKSADQTYRVFIEKMIEGAITLNEKGIILYSNTRFAELVNMPLSRIIGSHFETLVSKEYLQKFELLINEGWKAESKGEIYLRSSDNKSIPFLASFRTLDLDEGAALSLILTDLTAQKNTEEELRIKNELLQASHAYIEQLNNDLETKVQERTIELLSSREHFKFLANTVPVIIWTATPEGDFDYYNNQWYNYTGLSKEESLGQGWKKVIHPDDVAETSIAWDISIKSGEPFKREDRKRSASGDYRWHLAHALPFRDETGKLICWFGVCTNINDQKVAMEKKDEFISMASHELKTPVTSLKAFTQIMMLTFNPNEHTQAYSMLAQMDNQINKLTGLIGDLLDASKANAGQLNFNNEKFEISELIKEITTEVQRTTSSHKIELELPETVFLEGDKTRIGQVIMNLLSNAIKYSPAADKVIVTAVKNPTELEVRITDFGIGIPVADQPRLFTRFFRVNNNTTNTFPGLGLGLYICNEIIKRHHGTLGFRSEEGKGSTFYFTLPYTAEHA